MFKLSKKHDLVLFICAHLRKKKRVFVLLLLDIYKYFEIFNETPKYRTTCNHLTPYNNNNSNNKNNRNSNITLLQSWRHV